MMTNHYDDDGFALLLALHVHIIIQFHLDDKTFRDFSISKCLCSMSVSFSLIPLVCLSVYRSVCLLIGLFVSPSFCLSICLYLIRLFICLQCQLCSHTIQSSTYKNISFLWTKRKPFNVFLLFQNTFLLVFSVKCYGSCHPQQKSTFKNICKPLSLSLSLSPHWPNNTTEHKHTTHLIYISLFVDWKILVNKDNV